MWGFKQGGRVETPSFLAVPARTSGAFARHCPGCPCISQTPAQRRAGPPWHPPDTEISPMMCRMRSLASSQGGISPSSANRMVGGTCVQQVGPSGTGWLGSARQGPHSSSCGDWERKMAGPPSGGLCLATPGARQHSLHLAARPCSRTLPTLISSLPVPRMKPASVLPTPVANWPNAPALQVCESVPNSTSPAGGGTASG